MRRGGNDSENGQVCQRRCLTQSGDLERHLTLSDTVHSRGPPSGTASGYRLPASLACVISIRLSLLILIPILALSAACGSSGDDDGADPTSQRDDSSSPSATDDSGGDQPSGEAEIPEVKDGAFSEGNIHVEISGEQDVTFDADGGGLASGGLTLLQFASDRATVILTFQSGTESEPGGLSLTTLELSTAGGWGTECDVTLADSAADLKGEFRCEDIDSIDPRTTKSYKITVKGDFSVKR